MKSQKFQIPKFGLQTTKKMDAIEIDLEEAYQKGISDVVIETFFKKYPSARFYRFKSI